MANTKTVNDLREERMMKSISTLLEKPSDDAYGHAIGIWTNLLDTPKFYVKPDHFEFIFTHLLPSALNKEVRKDALKALKQTVPMLQNMDYKNHPQYKEFLEKSISTYMPRVKDEIEKIPEWALIWCLFLTVVRNDMARSIQINAFLSVAESGFRSNNIEMRTKSFLCWRKLIEIYATEGQLQHRKRVRLITVPLQTTASKNLDLATAKFGCWWYLINSISPEASEDHTKCFIHFLNFCFGPLVDRPLEGYVKNLTAVSPGKLYNELKMTVIVALVRVLGPSIPLIKSLKLDRPMDDLKPQFCPTKVFPICRREIIHCCAEATVLLNTVNKLSADSQLAITRNIWDNLFLLMKQDDKLAKSMFLTMEAVTAIVNISKDQRKSLANAIPVIFESIKATKFNLKGAQALTEFSLNMINGLSAAIKTLERPVAEKCFNELIVANYATIHMLDNKVNFAAALAKEVMKEPNVSSFVLWNLVWTKLLCVLEKSQPLHLEFVKFGLENHFNEMIQEREAWVFNWTVMPKNQYLNQVANIFQAAAKDEAASYNIVEVVTCMLNSTVSKYDKTSVPTDVLRVFNQQMDRFISTEFATTFVDSLTRFLRDAHTEQLFLILDDLNGTMKVLRKCSKSMNATESLSKLRSLLRIKIGLVERSTLDSAKAFLLLHKDWIIATPSTPGSANKKMGQPATPAPKKAAEDEFVPIKRDWSFDPKNLTDHQIERMKERRDDIPALYNDNSQSQDTRSLQPWALKTTPAAAGSDVKEQPKPEVSIFSVISGKKEQTPPIRSGDETGSEDLDTSKSEQQTQKRKSSRSKNELMRLAIDTVEGQVVFEGDKKTRGGRRTSLDIRGRDSPEIRTSPRKSSAGAEKKGEKGASTPSDKLKRRATINGEAKKDKEKQLKTVPETADTTPSKRAATKVTNGTKESQDTKETPTPVEANKDISAVTETPAQTTTVIKETPTPTPAVTVIKAAPVTPVIKPTPTPDPTPAITVVKETPPTVIKQTPEVTVAKLPVAAPAPVSAPVTQPKVVIPAANATTPKPEEAVKTVPELKKPVTIVKAPMVSIPTEVVLIDSSEPILEKAPVVIETMAETEPMVEDLPAVVTDGPTSEPMDVGSESFVEEMNLAVSANTSMNLQRSIVSSPEDLDNADERESTFLNDTINISPILKEPTSTQAKEAVVVVATDAPKVIGTNSNNNNNNNKAPDIMTTPKRPAESILSKENKPTPISTTPHSFASKLTGRGAMMLQQTKLFQESTPKEKAREEAATAVVVNKEHTLARMMVKTTAPSRSSPSTSILRRKRLEDDMDDTVESPAAKKKKVSFSDPPVSATKEFIRDSDRAKSNTLARMLMRKSRTDSASELQSLNVNFGNGGGPGSSIVHGLGLIAGSDSDEELGSMTSAAATADRRPMPMDDSKIFEYLQKKYTEGDEEEAPPKLPLSQIRTLNEVLLHSVANNASAKEEFFQKLMVTMPKEALQWSVRENSSYAFLNEVKEQVTQATFINYVVNQLKTDTEFQRKMALELSSRMDPAQTLDFIAGIVPRRTPL